MKKDWTYEFPAAITVSDLDGTILMMNEKSASVFSDDGGSKLIGKNLFDCHTPASAGKIKELIAENKSNAYTIEKNGKKKLIYQSPWYENGKIMGIAEISIEIPFDMPHFLRS